VIERIPILKIGDVLLVSIQGELDDRLAVSLREDLAGRITTSGAEGVLIDISSLDVVDSFIGRTLADIASVGRLLAVDTVLVGMRPAVAITLVELGLTLPGVRTALNVDRGLAMISRSVARVTGADRAGERSP